MKSNYIILLMLFIIMFNPINNLFGQNLNYSFFIFNQNYPYDINYNQYFPTIPNDTLVIHWDYTIASNLPLYLGGLQSNPITEELTTSEAEAVVIQAADMWLNCQTTKKVFSFNTNVASSNSISIIFDSDVADFGGSTHDNMLKLVNTILQGDYTKHEFSTTNMIMEVNACPDRDDSILMQGDQWQWTTNSTLSTDSTWYYFKSAILHELGHILGINHCNDYFNTVMYPILYPHIVYDHLYPKDTQALEYLFHETFDTPGVYSQSFLLTDPSIGFMRNTNNKGVIE